MTRTWVLLASVVSSCVVIDQLSKAWAESHLRAARVLMLVPGFLDLRYVHNRGAFYSLGEQLDADLRRTVFVLASLGVLGMIALFSWRSRSGALRLRLALALLGAGLFGNLLDRLHDGTVLDFVHVPIGPLCAATFNLADVWVVVGLVLLATDSTRPQRGQSRAGRAPALPDARTDGGY